MVAPGQVEQVAASAPAAQVASGQVVGVEMALVVPAAVDRGAAEMGSESQNVAVSKS